MMETQLPTTIRFGIAQGQGSPGSSYWKMRGAAATRDLYVMERNTGGLMHVSLHRDGRWHVKLKGMSPGDDSTWIRYTRPPELAPGITLALALVAPAAWGRGVPALDRVVWVVPEETPETEVRFDIFLEDPARSGPTIWPGQSSMGTQLVGRIRLGDGSTAVVVVKQWPAQSYTIEQRISLTPQQIADWRRRLTGATDPRVAIYGKTPEGAIVIRHGFADPGSFSR